MTHSLYQLRGAFQAYAAQQKMTKLALFKAVLDSNEKNQEFYFMGTSHTAGHRQLYCSFRVGAETVHLFPGDVENMLNEAQKPAQENEAFFAKFITEAKQALKDNALYESTAEQISSSYPKMPTQSGCAQKRHIA